MACGLLMLASPAGHGAVSLSGPYRVDPLGMPPLGSGDVDLPGATPYVGQGAPGSFAVLAGSQVALGRLNLGGRGEATARWASAARAGRWSSSRPSRRRRRRAIPSSMSVAMCLAAAAP